MRSVVLPSRRATELRRQLHLVVRGAAKRRTAVTKLRHQQHRAYISDYLRDVWRMGTLRPTNPLDELWEEDGADASSRATTPQKLPNLAQLQPHHVRSVWQQQQQNPSQSLASSDDESIKEEPSPHHDDWIQTLNDAMEGDHAMQQISASVMMLLHSDSKEWMQVAEEASSRASQSVPLKTLLQARQQLQEMENDDDHDNGITAVACASKILKFKFEDHTSTVSWNKEEEDDTDNTNPEIDERMEALQEVESSLLETSSATMHPQLVSDMYNYIGLTTERAKSLGYANVCEQYVSKRYAASSLEEIADMTQTVAQRATAKIKQTIPKAKSKEEKKLDTFMSSPSGIQSQNSNAALLEARMEEMNMLRLEQYVTVDGTLQFLFKLLQDLVGITFVEDKDENRTTMWDPDVRLFHAYDHNDGNEEEYLGSFYLDPVARPGKMEREATVPIIMRGQNRQPIVVLSLNLEAPAWDTDPIAVSWEGAESLFHEMGHVLQFLMAKSQAGCLLGPHMMPLDISELVPKFMEHWLTERSTVFALMHMSQTDKPFSEDALDLAFRVRSRTKAMKLAETAFNATLEWKLFSGLDLKHSDETIMQLQDRLAQEMISHDMPTDLSPLLDILQANARGDKVAWYRYLWCDVLSACLFQTLKERYEDNPDKGKQLRQDFARVLLEPGAAIDLDEIHRTFDIAGCTPETLFQRYDL